MKVLEEMIEASLNRTEETLEAFVKLFQKYGYRLCEDESLETGFQKIALFEKDGTPTHAARQLPDGNWTSKIGGYFDVKHTLKAMNGGRYSEAVLFLKRPA